MSQIPHYHAAQTQTLYSSQDTGKNLSTASWSHGSHHLRGPACQATHEMSSGLAQLQLQTQQTDLRDPANSFSQCSSFPTLVDKTRKPLHGRSLPAMIPNAHAHHGRFPNWLGSASRETQGTRPVVRIRDAPTHKSLRAQSSVTSMPSLSSPHKEQIYSGLNRQHSMYVLHQQIRGSPITFPMHGSHPDMELVHTTSNTNHCLIPTWLPQYYGRCSQQALFDRTQMGTAPRNTSTALLPLGHPINRPLCHNPESKMSPVLLQSGTQDCIPRRRIPHPVEQLSSVRLPTNPSATQGSLEDHRR
ncbi:uncharacterized protein LOC122460309 [Dermochelys coriacea]|uniref:uncharacterized protein LOC122460309 n=1 Tax=Dermochelys coriacea TaxID=27794 RepID=UPI001CA90546|nr:uncharacterized protein LOC122460309 [Dermochelys coriacea]